MTSIYHLAPLSEWQHALATGRYWPSESRDNFIHFSFAPQLVEVANRLFRGRTDLLLLEVERQGVESDLRVESFEPGGEPYPHLYRALNPSEVICAVPFLPQADGSFVWRPDSRR